jgi:hypothetical protein
LISYSSYVRSIEYAGMLGEMVLLMGDGVLGNYDPLQSELAENPTLRAVRKKTAGSISGSRIMSPDCEAQYSGLY